MKDLFINIFGAPLLGLYKITGDYALSILLFLVIVRILYIIFDYAIMKNRLNNEISKPYMLLIKQRFCGKDADKYADASVKILKTTNTHFFLQYLPFIIQWPVYLIIIYILYHPVSMLCQNLKNSIPDMCEIATKIHSSGTPEFDLINAVKSNPNAFNKFDISAIEKINTKIFNLDLIQPANIHSANVIIPLITLAFFLFSIVSILIPVFKKKRKLSSVALILGFDIIIAFSLSASAFRMPIMFHAYFIVFAIISMISSRLLQKFFQKYKRKSTIQKDEKCREIMKEYGFDDLPKSRFKKEEEVNGENTEQKTESIG